MTQRTALLAGATGLIGRELLSRLLAGDDYDRIRVLCRRPPAQTDPRLDIRVTPFARLAELAAEEPGFFAVDDVHCCLGTTLAKAGSRAGFAAVDRDYVRDIATNARHAGARRFFLVSAVGADPRSPFFYNRIKGQAEAAVAALDYAAVHIVRPSLLLGHRDETRPGEAIGQRLAPLLTPVLAGPLAKYRPIEAGAVAAHMRDLARGDATGVHVSHPSAMPAPG